MVVLSQISHSGLNLWLWAKFVILSGSRRQRLNLPFWFENVIQGWNYKLRSTFRQKKNLLFFWLFYCRKISAWFNVQLDCILNILEVSNHYSTVTRFFGRESRYVMSVTSSLTGIMCQHENRTLFQVLRTYHWEISIYVPFLWYLVPLPWSTFCW